MAAAVWVPARTYYPGNVLSWNDGYGGMWEAGAWSTNLHRSSPSGTRAKGKLKLEL